MGVAVLVGGPPGVDDIVNVGVYVAVVSTVKVAVHVSVTVTVLVGSVPVSLGVIAGVFVKVPAAVNV